MATNTTKRLDPAAEPRPRPEPPKQVSCEACMRQLIREDAYRSESEDYVLWFCGLNCFETWKDEDVGGENTKIEENETPSETEP